MRRSILCLSAALALSACGLPGLMTGAPPAVGQAACAVDNELTTAWKAFDLALDGINLLGDKGEIVPGSPKGKAVAAGIRAVNAALGRAERFAATCSEREKNAALNEAEAGMAAIGAALKGN